MSQNHNCWYISVEEQLVPIEDLMIVTSVLVYSITKIR